MQTILLTASESGATQASPWKRARAAHRWTFAALVLLVIALGGGVQVAGESALIGAALLGAAILGVPHGALDTRAGGEVFRATLGSKWWLAFAGGYVGLAIATLMLWSWAPRVALASFLLVASIHFSEDSVRRLHRSGARSVALARGAFPIALPCLIHAPECTTLFNLLLPTSAALRVETVRWIATLALALIGPVLVSSSFEAIQRARSKRDRSGSGSVLTLIALAGLFAFTSPLVSFALFFCLWHSARHTLDLAQELDSSSPSRGLWRFIVEAAPLTLLTWCLAGLAWVVLRNTGIDHDALNTRVLFIGLSALTVPHLVVQGLARHFREGNAHA